MIVSKLEPGSPIVSPGLQRQRLPYAFWLILAAALLSRVWGSWYGYPNILHPDEHHIIDRALNMLKAPSYDLNPHFFDYPSLYLYLIALLYLLTGVALLLGGMLDGLGELHQFARQHVFYFHLLGRLMTAGFGVATIYLLFKSVRQLYGQTMAQLAAWFLTLSYLHFTDSHYVSTDVPSAFFVVWAFSLSVTALVSRRLKTLLFAAFVCGLAASIKYPAGLILLTILGAALKLCRETETAWLRTFLKKRFWKLSAMASLGFLVGTPYAVFDLKAFAGGLINQLLHSGLGHLGVEESGFFGYFTKLVPAGGMGAALVLAALGGLLFTLRGLQWRDGLLLSFPFIFYLLLGRSTLQVDRYLIPAIPFFCIYAAIFAERTAALMRARSRAALVAMTMLLSLQPAYYLLQWCWIVTQPDTRNEAALWIEENISNETLIASRIGSWKFPHLNEADRKLRQLDMFTEESARARLGFKLRLLQTPATAWIFREVFHDTVRIEELQALVDSLPTFTNWRAPTLQALREEGVQVVITSSLLEERFSNATLEEKFPEMAKSWQEFFASVAREGRLLKEFSPPRSVQHPWGLGFLERPVIRIYAIR